MLCIFHDQEHSPFLGKLDHWREFLLVQEDSDADVDAGDSAEVRVQ